MITSKLRDKTLKLLRERKAKITMTSIAKDTDLPIGWLKSFHKDGHKMECSVNRVETLFKHLTGREVGL